MNNITLKDVLKESKRTNLRFKVEGTEIEADDESSLTDKVQELTGLNILKQIEHVLRAIDKGYNASHFVEIETLEIEKMFKVNEDTLRVIYNVYGCPTTVEERVDVDLPITKTSVNESISTADIDRMRTETEGLAEGIIDAIAALQRADIKDDAIKHIYDILNNMNDLALQLDSYM